MMRFIRSLFAWRHVGDLGVWRYWENEMTGERWAQRISGCLGPQHSQWLAGGAWEQKRPAPPAPITPRVGSVGSIATPDHGRASAW